MIDIFDLEKAKQAEAERRFAMIGDLKDVSKRNYTSLRERAKETLVSAQILVEWCRAYDVNGFEGLKPNWSELSSKAQDSISTIYNQIESIADEEIITKQQIADLAEELGWKVARVARWIKRYRCGGLWYLVPQNKTQIDNDIVGKTKRLPRDVGTLDEKDLQEMFRRYQVLGILAEKSKPTRDDWKNRAVETGVSERTLRHYHAAYQKYGLSGLAPQIRSDKGKNHNISDRMVNIIRAFKFQHPALSVSGIKEKASEKAKQLGEPEPSTWQVRSICKSIRNQDLILAEGNETEFRNKYAITYPNKPTEGLVYLIDWTEADIFVLDRRKSDYRKKTGKIRPYLITCMENNSRRFLARHFSYDRPNRFMIAAVLRAAIIVGGRPTMLTVDNGTELVSHHVRDFCQSLQLEISTAKLPDLTCLICEQLLVSSGQSAGDITTEVSYHVHTLSQLIVRLYDQTDTAEIKKRCLDLLDELLQKRVYALEQVLEAYNRR
jgi:hypothetical protein